MLVTGSLTVGWAVALVVLLIWYVPFLKRGRARAAAEHASPDQRDNGSKTVSSTDTPGSSTKS
jgi:hypothetical protein